MSNTSNAEPNALPINRVEIQSVDQKLCWVTAAADLTTDKILSRMVFVLSTGTISYEYSAIRRYYRSLFDIENLNITPVISPPSEVDLFLKDQSWITVKHLLSHSVVIVVLTGDEPVLLTGDGTSSDVVLNNSKGFIRGVFDEVFTKPSVENRIFACFEDQVVDVKTASPLKPDVVADAKDIPEIVKKFILSVRDSGSLWTPELTSLDAVRDSSILIDIGESSSSYYVR